jgi:PA-IL-like protein/EF hand domain-containing protein
MYAQWTRLARVNVLRVLAAGAIVVGSVGVARAVENVQWNNVSNATPHGNGLQKTAGCQGCEDSGGESRQMIRGDGYAEFSVGEPYTFWMAGLSRPNGPRQFEAIDFAWRFNGDGRADIMENGRYQPGVDEDYVPGDTFRVAVANGRVQYFKNGRMLLESRQAPRFPLVLKAVLGTEGATIRNARIETAGGYSTSNYGDDRVRPYGNAPGGEFRSLDRNGDGVIERREWQGTRAEFNQMDANRDGVLSRREFAQGSYDGRDNPTGTYGNDRYGDYGYRGTGGEFFEVDGVEPWTDTGIWIQAGDVVTLNAQGSMRLSMNRNDVSSPAGAQSGRRANNAPVRNAAAGALLMRIDNGAPVVVGNGRTIRATASGELFLGINDDYTEDNRGSYRVSVDVNSRY